MAILVNKKNREVKVIIPNMREFRVFYSDNEGSVMFFKRDWIEEKKEEHWKPSEDELAKRHLEGYIMGREDTMREMKDFIESHFNTNKAREGEDLTDLYRKEYAQPLCLRNGGVCTNPMRDCINCIPTLERFNTSSGTSTLKAEG